MNADQYYASRAVLDAAAGYFPGGVMTTSELRAAAEMIVATGMHREWADSIDAGAVAVARAWIAEHPCDGDEQAIWPWLGEVGFVELNDEVSRFARNGFGIDITGSTGGSTLWLDNKAVCDDPTRGDVRRLLKALGVTAI